MLCSNPHYQSLFSLSKTKELLTKELLVTRDLALKKKELQSSDEQNAINNSSNYNISDSNNINNSINNGNNIGNSNNHRNNSIKNNSNNNNGNNVRKPYPDPTKYVEIVDNVLSKQECKNLVFLSETLGYEKSTQGPRSDGMGNPDTGKSGLGIAPEEKIAPGEVRNHARCMVDSEEMAAVLLHRLLPFLPKTWETTEWDYKSNQIQPRTW